VCLGSRFGKGAVGCDNQQSLGICHSDLPLGLFFCRLSMVIFYEVLDSSLLKSNTTIVAHRSACFGQNNMLIEDVHPSDVSAVAMESVTSL